MVKKLAGALVVAFLVASTLSTAALAQRRFLSLASGWVVGVYYPIAGAMSRIIYKADIGIRLTVESSGASVANAKLIQSGDADFAILQNDIAYYAYRGETLEAFRGDPVANMRGVLGMHLEPVQLVARADARINSVADLRGKRVNLGPLGSGAEQNALQVLEAYGLSVRDLGRAERLSAAEAADYLKDGRIEAAFFTVGLGAAAIQDVAVVTPIKIVPVDEPSFASLRQRYPFYAREVIPPGVYKGVDAPVPTVAVRAIMVARAELEDEIVYKVLKAIFNDLDTLYTAHAAAKQITLEKALDAMPVPLHPGAEQFYREAGLL
ncbi:MAG: TAXI family TRAP transporter solute-binding subunit [Bacillota bacterium]